MLARHGATLRSTEIRGAQKVLTGKARKAHDLSHRKSFALYPFFLVNQGAAVILIGERWVRPPTMSEYDLTSGKRTAVAVRMAEPADAEGFPGHFSWEAARSVRFNADWQGKNADPRRETEVRLLWAPEALYVQFRARYRVITIFPDAAPSGRRDQLWEHDVAEVFLQPNPSEPRRYKEFEVSPNGYWIDLDIAAGEKHDLGSRLKRRVIQNATAKTWIAELALPMNSLVEHFDAAAIWRVNFYRVEGAIEPRFYSAWQPTGTPVPNFHVPEAFGRLVFAPSQRQQER
jgi:cellulose/xylan binding protein with CBM9 domain